jgi:type II secretory pathway pseudopilin PulG
MRKRRSDDDGISLVETVVAMMLFAVVAAVSAGLLGHIMGATRNNTQRVTAANLAAQYIEEIRGQRALDIPDGGKVYAPVLLAGTAYTVQRTANYVESDSATSLCAGTGSSLVYKLVTVTVTWPDMGTTEPVRSDTLKALGVGVDDLNPTLGMAAVQLLDEGGKALPGVAVTISPGGIVVQTGIDGCAVFPNLDPATTYTASVDQAGHTALRGEQLVQTASLTIKAGEVTRTSLSYDKAGSLRVALSYPAGYLPPGALGVTLANTAWSEKTNSFPDCATVSTAPQGCVSGTPRTASRLFPGAYGAWAGACAPEPATVSTTRVDAGKASDVTVPLAPLVADLRDSAGEPLPNTTLYLTAKSATPCVEKLAAVSDATGTVATSLPSGTWILSLTSDGSGAPVTGWPEVTLDAYAGGSVPRITVQSP